MMKKKTIFMALAVGLVMTACEKQIMPDGETGGDDGNVRLTFIPTTADMSTRGTVAIGDYFSRLAVQLFDEDGNKVFSQSKTQTKDDDDFGTLSVGLTSGTYTVVAVGHSSPVTPTIKSTELVQFTAKDGVKNSDTFCHYGQVTVAENGGSHELRMNRLVAMVTFMFTDDAMPDGYAGLRVEYSGGSANFNPSTGEGCTKSNQTETRGNRVTQCQVFTFPYLATECKLKMTLVALDGDGNNINTKVLSDVPVTRNRITRCTGQLFGDGNFDVIQTNFGLTVNGDWEGEDQYSF